MRWIEDGTTGFARTRGRRVALDDVCPTIIDDPRLYVLDDGAGVVTEPSTVEKPPYAVPSMEAIAATRGTNGLSVVSTFSGCGGSCLGYELAGYRVLWASEFVPEARETYALNHPGVPIDDRDIRDVRPEEILEAIGLEAGALDVLEGSPPCSSFSTAGSRHKGWGQSSAYSGTKQRTDDLFFEFARIVEGVQPKAFTAENVSGLVKGVAKGYFKEILARLRDCGYRVEARLLEAQWLGVPQARQRLIFVGVRNDVDRSPAWPKPFAYRYSIADALPWLTSVERINSDGGRYREADDVASPTVLSHSRGQSTIAVEESGEFVSHDPETGYQIALEGSAIAPAWDHLAEGESSERYFNLVRPDRNRPAPTVTQVAGGRGTAGITHPTQRRKFTLLELRRVCGFPDSFALTGTYPQRWERLGRAVPPPMMYAVAKALREEVFDVKCHDAYG